MYNYLSTQSIILLLRIRLQRKSTKMSGQQVLITITISENSGTHWEDRTAWKGAARCKYINCDNVKARQQTQ
jgi:hypothetical protein